MDDIPLRADAGKVDAAVAHRQDANVRDRCEVGGKRTKHELAFGTEPRRQWCVDQATAGDMLVNENLHGASMLVIPVLDLMAGQVVHARRGERSAYRPLESKLTPSSDPVQVAGALLALAPFATLYVADLDAIRRRGEHRATLDRIQAAFPALELWVDAGFGVPADLARWSHARRTPVIGSESVSSAAAFAALRTAAPQAVLSLDARGDERLGPAALFERPEL